MPRRFGTVLGPRITLMLCPRCRIKQIGLALLWGIPGFAGGVAGLILVWPNVPVENRSGAIVGFLLGTAIVAAAGFVIGRWVHRPFRFRRFSKDRNTVELRFKCRAFTQTFRETNGDADERMTRELIIAMADV